MELSLQAILSALESGFTLDDISRLSVRRERRSVTQGEDVVCVDGV
ncbi:MAG: hypothetical protein ACI4PG_02225 [Candidatus Ventricola sp.]